MLKHRILTYDRITHFTTAFHTLFWREKLPLEATVSQRTTRISHDEAMQLKYRPVTAGMEFGPRFATYWFKLRGNIPEAWRKSPVDLIFNTASEGTVWLDGKPVQGINPSWAGHWPHCNRFDFRLPKETVRGGKIDLAVEMSCNQLFGYHSPGEYKFIEASMALFDPEAWRLYHDVFVPWKVLAQREDKTKLTPFEGFIFSRLNEICNRVDPADRSTWANARPLLDEIYAQKNGSIAVELSAIGHAHIDTAWLWPLDETRRKCIRTFSSALKLMQEFPEYKFSCSQAFQYQWMKDHAPSIYAGIKAAVKRGQWVPVGGTWVEPDCNIPAGESLARQFLYGKRFFRKEFGWDCKEFWNPDVFGYNGQLPQIMKLSGVDYFLTQKLSWNQFNKPQHQNFIWKGIDGTGVLTHFPPADTYNAMNGELAVADLRNSETKHQDLERTREAMLLFGWGDGGGGPTRHMLEVLRRAEDFQGLPRTRQRTSLDFFKRLEISLTDAPVIAGELYFELHRATYTSQAANKRDNRASELALRRVELLASLAAREGRAYPQAEFERLWKIVLVNQFHDILPGSSITQVYQDSAKDYAGVLVACAQIEAECLAVLTRKNGAGYSVFNPLSWQRTGLVEIPKPVPGSQKSYDGEHLCLAAAPSMGGGPLKPLSPPDQARVTSVAGGFVLENATLRAAFARNGQLTSLVHLPTGREVLSAGSKGNQFLLFDDKPVNFDAWDVDAYHLETRQELPGATGVDILEKGPLRAGLEFKYTFGPTSVVQRVFLSAGSGHLEFDTEADWHHSHKFLKVEFPFEVHAREATYEMPFGLAKRPTTFNNSYEIAQFEVCGHRWVDLSEPGFGASIFTDSKYGYSCHGNVMRISLLRAPADPDPVADQGRHHFRYAVYPHAGGLVEGEVVRRAHEFNQPLIAAPGTLPAHGFFSVDNPNLILDTVKQAEDSKALIVRLYECHGARGKATLTTGFPIKSAVRTNLLEEQTAKAATKGQSIGFDFRPFEIITFKLEIH